MLWLVIGGIGSGKTAFAEELAETVGLEGIRLSCSAFPGESEETGPRPAPAPGSPFAWTETAADRSLAAKLHAINVESNIFRADRRVLVVDSLSGWLRQALLPDRPQDPEAEQSNRAEADFRELIAALLAFQGKLIVVSEEPAAGLALSPRERLYAYRLAEAARALADESRALYRLTAGVATEIKGYRVKRGGLAHENIYEDRR